MKEEAKENMKEKRKMKQEWKVEFFSVIGIGLFAHGYMFLHNFLSADAMWNLYADQNMITSGRWLLGLSCSISSYYQLPWVIGCLSLIWLGISAVAIVELFSIKRTETCILIGGLLVTFPALVSTFSYLYTADGYMLAVCFVCISMLFLQKYKWGFVPAGLLLGGAIGIYQAYLAFAVLLCLALLFIGIFDGKKPKELWIMTGKMLAYGGIGISFYFAMLQLLLKIQGVQLSTYQGINEMGKISFLQIPALIGSAYRDFFSFAVRSKILVNNWVSIIGVFGILILAILVLVQQGKKIQIIKSPGKIIAGIFLLAITPLATNIILLVSNEVNNHLVMRFHWVLFLIFPFILVDRYFVSEKKEGIKKIVFLGAVILGGLLIFQNAVHANIGYYNMNERYEKTYAYCVRLANRMEETPGYYTGIPVMMIGVVDEKEYPNTDTTIDITGSMIGVNGSIFLYTGEQYQAFFSHYLGMPLNIIDAERIKKIYDSTAYRELETFPSMQAMKVIDGILYIKTEQSE